MIRASSDHHRASPNYYQIISRASADHHQNITSHHKSSLDHHISLPDKDQIISRASSDHHQIIIRSLSDFHQTIIKSLGRWTLHFLAERKINVLRISGDASFTIDMFWMLFFVEESKCFCLEGQSANILSKIKLLICFGAQGISA